MNELTIFTYNDNEVRTVQQGGETWFVLKDVCQVLDLGSPHKVAERLDVDERNQIPVTDSLGRPQETTIINESGLYNVILRSDKPEAKPFRKWVTSEVLPSIRKHGAYMTQETLQAAIQNQDYLLQIVTALKDETDKRKALEAENSSLVVNNQIMRPKADYFDELVERNTLTNFRETAKELHIPPQKFVKFLIEKKYIYRDKKGKLLPCEAKNDGLFEVKECANEKTKWSGTQTLITPKGRETFRLLYIAA
jgi:prophage antirepressor-like protein